MRSSPGTTSEADRSSRTDVVRASLGTERFRPNVVVEGASTWAEHEWAGVTLGSVAFENVKQPCARCQVTSIDQSTTGPPEPLRTLNAVRKGSSFGYGGALAGGAFYGNNLVSTAISF
mmetsp:Transcript_28584/g.93411  ORF Transcript_28584/g.93411 Transcript_28584/m.93411 type:complete len:118 (-) Transcript_28584:1447-1800(-)